MARMHASRIGAGTSGSSHSRRTIENGTCSEMPRKLNPAPDRLTEYSAITAACGGELGIAEHEHDGRFVK